MTKPKSNGPTLQEQVDARLKFLFLNLKDGGRAIADLYNAAITTTVRVAALRMAARWLRDRGIRDTTVLELEAGAAMMELEAARRASPNPVPAPNPDYDDDPDDDTVIVSTPIRPKYSPRRRR